jgi:hypothetical protein
MAFSVSKVARLTLGACAAMSAALVPTTAAADDASATTSVDMPQPTEDAGKHVIDRTWLYADDARVAAPLVFIGTTSLSYTSVGSSPSRIVDPFPGCSAPCNAYNSFAGNTGTPGGMVGVGGEVGLVPRLSVMAMGQVGLGGSDNAPSPSAGVITGLRFQILPSVWQNTHLVLSAGYLREAWQGPVFDGDTRTWHGGSPNGDSGGWIQAAFSGDIQRLRLATTLHGEHVFAAGRDGLDLMVEGGASYRIAGDFRAGLEYVGQDLEESFASGPEGGARHFLGPIASLQLLSDRLTMVAGPALGLSSRSPDFLGRFALSYGF